MNIRLSLIVRVFNAVFPPKAEAEPFSGTLFPPDSSALNLYDQNAFCRMNNDKVCLPVL